MNEVNGASINPDGSIVIVCDGNPVRISCDTSERLVRVHIPYKRGHFHITEINYEQTVQLSVFLTECLMEMEEDGEEELPDNS